MALKFRVNKATGGLSLYLTGEQAKEFMETGHTYTCYDGVRFEIVNKDGWPAWNGEYERIKDDDDKIDPSKIRIDFAGALDYYVTGIKPYKG